MLGKHFIIASPSGEIHSAGEVLEQLTEGSYRVRLRDVVPYDRVVNVDQMGNWLIFDSEEHLGKWMSHNVKQQQPEGVVTPDTAPPPVPDAEETVGDLVDPADMLGEQGVVTPDDSVEVDGPIAVL